MAKKLTIMQNTVYNTIGSFFYLACQWLITVLVIRLGSVESGGVLTLAMSVTTLFYTLSAIGRTYQVSDYQQKYAVGEYVATRFFSCSCALILCVGYCLVYRGYSHYEIICIFAYMGFRTVEALSDEYQAIQQTAERMDCIFWSFLARGILLLSSFSATLALTKDVFYALCAMCVSTGLVVLIYDVPVCHRLLPYRVQFQLKRSLRLLADNVPMMLNSLLMVCCVTIPRTALNRLWGNYVMGVYGSISAPAAIVQNVAVWLFLPFITRFTAHYNEGERDAFYSLHRRILVLMGGAGVLILIMAKLLGKWALNLVFGPEIAEYDALLIPTLMTTVMIAAEYYISTLLTVTRSLKAIVVGNVAALLATLALSDHLVKSFGAYGVNDMIYISMGVNLIIQYIALTITLRKRFSDYAKTAVK